MGNVAKQLSQSKDIGKIRTADQLESLVLAAASERIGSITGSDYTEFKRTSGFTGLKNIIQETSLKNARTGVETNLSLADVCTQVSTKLLEGKKFSLQVNKYVVQLSASIGKVGDTYLKKLEKEIVEIDGQKYIASDKFNRNDYTGEIKAVVSEMDSQVSADKTLTDDDRKMLAAYTAVVKTNIDEFDTFFAKLFKLDTRSGRVLGLWSAIKAIFSSVGAAITTIVCVALGTLIGAYYGGMWGAIAGFTIGAALGYGISCENYLTALGPVQCDDCATFLGSGCDLCQTAYPFYVTWSCN